MGWRLVVDGLRQRHGVIVLYGRFAPHLRAVDAVDAVDAHFCHPVPDIRPGSRRGVDIQDGGQPHVARLEQDRVVDRIEELVKDTVGMRPHFDSF